MSSYSNGSSTFAIQPLLERLNSQDSDFRFMSLSDLHSILSNTSVALSNDSSTISKIIDGILRSLSDNNAEVQNLAVKCLSPLVTRINDNQIASILTKLSTISSNAEDVSFTSTAIRTIITSAPANPTSGKLFVNRLLSSLLPNLQSSTDNVDVLVDLINKFGPSFTLEQVEKTESVLVEVLENGRGLTRKRAISALGALSVFLTPKLWDSLIDYILKLFETDGISYDKLRTIVSVCGTLCKTDPNRFSQYLLAVTPNVIKCLNIEDDEVREAALTTLDIFIEYCPGTMSNFTYEIITVGSKFVKYDPNYATMEEDEEPMDDVDEEEEDDDDDGFDDEFDEDNTFSDDDDVSWKLRRCSAKLLCTLIQTRPDILSQLYSSVAPLLIGQFKEREESVRTEILNTFATLIKQTNSTSGFGARRKGKRRMSDESMILEADPRTQLFALAGRVFKLLAFHLQKTSGVPTKRASLTVATELISSIATLPIEFPIFVCSVESVLNIGTLRTDIVKLIRALVTHHSREELNDYIPTLSNILLSSIDDKFYKISSEALLVTYDFILMLTSPAYEPSVSTYIRSLHSAIVSKVTASDADLDVRERAITCLGLMLIRAINAFSSAEVTADTNLILDRLRNETTRLASIRCINDIGISEGQSFVSDEWVVSVISELATLLRKSNRALRLSAVGALKSVTDKFANQVDVQTSKAIVQVFRGIMSEDDLQMLGPALSILNNLMPVLGNAGIDNDILERIISIVPSSMTGSTAEPMINLLSSLAKMGKADELYNSLASSMETCSRAIAVIVHSGGLTSTKLTELREMALQDENETNSRNALMVLSELARLVNTDEVEIISTDLLFSKFQNTVSEEVRVAAAQTFGALASGRPSAYLPQIIEQLVSDSPNAFLLLVTVKEVLAFHINDPESLSPYLEDLWNHILGLEFVETTVAAQGIAANSSSAAIGNEKDGAKTRAAECIGRIALFELRKFLPDLQTRLQSSSAATRNIIISSLRYIFKAEIVEGADIVNDLFRPIVVDFISRLEDSDLDNIRLVLSAISSIAQSKPVLLAEHLNKLVPLLYECTVLRKDLVREVQMGPFKHKVDDGLDARKIAYDAVYAILISFKSFKNELDLPTMCERAIAGIDDDHDIKINCYLMIGKIASTDTSVIASKLDILAKKFGDVLTQKLKDNAIKQEIEKLSESQRRVMQATEEIQKSLLEASSTGNMAAQGENPAWEQYINSTYSRVKSLNPQTSK
ncbi:armadillo-type protein [Dipodascopsis uninucleata]